MSISQLVFPYQVNHSVLELTRSDRLVGRYALFRPNSHSIAGVTFRKELLNALFSGVRMTYIDLMYFTFE